MSDTSTCLEKFRDVVRQGGISLYLVSLKLYTSKGGLDFNALNNWGRQLKQISCFISFARRTPNENYFVPNKSILILQRIKWLLFQASTGIKVVYLLKMFSGPPWLYQISKQVVSLSCAFAVFCHETLK